VELEQFLPKFAGEGWITVKDNRVRHSINFKDIIHKILIHGGFREWVLESIDMIIFGKTITTTMMNNLLPDLGNPTMKSIEISIHITGAIGRVWSVPGILIVFPLLH
jgi:hypothetical protein